MSKKNRHDGLTSITFRDAYMHERRRDDKRTAPQVFKSGKEFNRKALRSADRRRFQEWKGGTDDQE